MSTCKDCIHFKICKYYDNHLTEEDIKAGQDIKDLCQHFKDSSKFIELPCKFGDTVFVVCRSCFSENVAVREEIVKGLQYIHNHWYINTDKHYNYEYGEKVFSNYEEAEKALKERESNV